MSQPLTDAIEALTTYANSVTGESDATLSEAVATLASGYGGGGISVDDIATGAEPSGAISLTANNIRYGAFAYTRNLISVSMPNVATIQNYAFFHSSLASIYAPSLTAPTYAQDAFAYTNLTQLTDAEFPNLTSCNGNSATYLFEYCTSVTKIFLSKLTQTGTGTFRRQTALLTAVFPAFTGYCGTSTFEYCSALTAVDMNKPSFAANSFLACSNLTTVVLRGNGVASLANISAFNNTPFASGKAGGTLYVPQSLISSYQSASNWSTILGYANNQILPIEGSQYEHYYADGTPIE